MMTEIKWKEIGANVKQKKTTMIGEDGDIDTFSRQELKGKVKD